MDPISQGAVGAAFSQASQTISALRLDREKIVAASWLGCLAGMAPDLDVLIQSPTDPLLFLEFHRHFTHALIFIPFGAGIVFAALFWSVRNTLKPTEAYLACFIGYATHGLLDACTSYGTQLFWPFSDMRVAWNNVSVVDPLLTIPLLLAVIVGARLRRPVISLIGIGWMLSYLVVGVVQMNRAIVATHDIASARGHVPSKVTVKPSFANVLVWKSIYEFEDYFYVDAVRVGTIKTYCAGQRAERLDWQKHLPFVAENSQQARDIARFAWFSDDYLAVTTSPYEIIDLRYSIVPNQIDPMWGIRIDPDAKKTDHVAWFSTRETDSTETRLFWRMLTGEVCSKPVSEPS